MTIDAAISRRPPTLFMTLFAVILLAGCVTPSEKGSPPAVPLEEARKTQAAYDGGTFSPPPRSIKDILHLLAQERPDDLESYERAVRMADSKAPQTTDALELAQFYLDRGHAAHEVGRARQEIHDYRASVRYGAESGFKCQERVKWKLATAEARGGNLSRAIEIANQLIEETDREGSRLFYRAILAWFHAQQGNLVAAQDALNRAETAWNSIRSRSMTGRNRDTLLSTLSSGRAAVFDLMGKLYEGEAQHREAIRRFEGLKNASPWPCSSQKDMPRIYNWKLYDFAGNLLRQGRLLEAEVEARKALEGALGSHGRYSAHTAYTIQRLNEVIFEQGRLREAELLAGANLRIYEHTKAAVDSLMLADARSVLANAYLAQRKWQKALSEYDAICETLKTDRDTFEGFVASRANLWLAWIKGGRSSDAVVPVRTALDQKKRRLGERHYDTAETHGILAMALAANDEKESALKAFSTAVPILLEQSSRIGSGEGTWTSRDFRFELILDSYIQLLAGIHGGKLERTSGIEAAAEAFRLADVARGRTVKRAIALSSARAAAKDPALTELARQEQDALIRIRALSGLLSHVLTLPPDQQDPEAVGDLRSRIDQLHNAREALMIEIQEGFPDYVNLINPKPIRVEETRSNLRPGEALIAIYVGEQGTCVWAVPHRGRVAFTSTGLNRKDVESVVKALRASLDPRAGTTLGELPVFDFETAHRLYKALLEPVEAGWKDAENLLVVPHGALGFLPFSILPTKAFTLGTETVPLFSNYRSAPWLARTHSVSVLPSVTSLRTLRSIPAGDPLRKPFTGFGNPSFSPAPPSANEPVRQVTSATSARSVPLNRRGLKTTSVDGEGPARAAISSLPPLPDTVEEVQEIALALKANPESDVYLGKAASEDRVKSMDLSGIRILAFATHGLLPGELDGLDQPALALSSPEVTGGREDGLLTMGEILGIQLNADWVVLSACNTGAGGETGAEALSGLGRSFFYAGARSLLVSNWPVETTSAKTLTTGLFRRQVAEPSLKRSEVLNRTMLDLIDRLTHADTRGKTVFSYAHPVFWAPFSLVGDGGSAN